MLFREMQLKSVVAAVFVVCFSLGTVLAQSSGTSGSIDGKVVDSTGAVIQGAEVKLQHPTSGFSQTAMTDSNGQFHFRNLPYNSYHLSVTHAGFAPQAQDMDIRSAIAVTPQITLGVAGASTTVNVEAGGEDLVENDPNYHTDVDKQLFDKIPLSGSSQLSTLVTNAVPGVAADSNGLLHSMGDHAENTFVPDGQPISDQQSKVFSNQLPVDSIAAMEVIAGAPPAEYGDKTSLVIKVTTRSGLGQTKPTGTIWGSYGTQAGSGSAGHRFHSDEGGLNLAMGSQRFGNFISLSGLYSGRFLDPPEFQVLHAKGNEQNAFDRIDTQISEADAFHVNLGFTRSWFQTPNSFDTQFAIVPSLPGTLLVQDQRSQIKTYNLAPSWTHTFGTSGLFTLLGFYRQDQYAYFPSRNVLADQPQTINQKRRLANAGVRSDFSYVKGIHNVKIGATYEHWFLTENFGFGITDSTINSPCLNADGTLDADTTVRTPAQCGALAPNPAFASDLLPVDLTRGGRQFFFHGHADIRELGLYLQDAITAGNWTFNLGVRGDLYRGITRDSQAEPRAGVAYNIKKTNTVLRVSYGRMMETPFNENLVLASRANGNPVVSAVIGPSLTAPLRPGIRNEFHAGFQQAFGKYLVVDADYMWKYTHNGYDFSVFGITPITFPIEWHNSKIGGPSARISIPTTHGFTAFTVLGNVYARFFPPQIGGLGATAVTGGQPFRIDHDQAFQQTTHVQYQPWKRGPWFAFNWRYDSGLVAGRVPVATDTSTPVDLTMLSADQQLQAGLHCGDVFPTLTSPLTTCDPASYGSTRIKLPFPGTANPDHNPARINPRHLVDLSIGHDNIFNTERYRLSARLTAVNVTNKVALYNFLSTFSGTHFVTPRTVSGELAIHF